MTRRGNRFGLAALLVVVGCDASSCNGGGGLDFTNGVDPTEDVPAELVHVSIPGRGDIAVWSTVWDNPPVMGLARLKAYQAAERGGQYTASNEWIYTEFDLVAAVDPPSANPALPGPNPDEPRVLRTWPHQAGEYEAGALMFWEAHGLALSPRLTMDTYEAIVSVQALRADENVNNVYDPYSDYVQYEQPGAFQLDSETLLVPLNVVVLHVPGDGNVGADWLPRTYLQTVFDDYWTGDTAVYAGPFSLWATLGDWEHGCDDCPPSSPMTRPDRVWDQCGIQFRAVTYHECPVSADLFWYDVPALGLDLQDTCNPNKVDALVQQALAGSCPEFDSSNGAATVIFTGKLIYQPPCNIQGTTTYGVKGWTAPGDNRTYIATSGLSGLLLSHEIGHILGLEDTSCAAPKTLMCSTDPSPDASPHCAAARAKAATRQSTYW